MNRIVQGAMAVALSVGASHAEPVASTSSTTTYHRVQIHGVHIFYREAGPALAPAILLLHGFPASSRQFEGLIPLLAVRYHVIAPDYPGFGLSDAPSPAAYAYTFDHLAQTMTELLELIGVSRFTVYLHDYGAPIGLRLATAHPERVDGLIVQNGNVYRAGLGSKWGKIAEYWENPGGHPEVLDTFLSFDSTRDRHVAGTHHLERYNPDSWIREYADLSRPGQREIQGSLLYDYRTNLALYPAWQAWLREHQPPTLVIWGKQDPSFIAPGAQAYSQDLPQAEVHLLDAGHFALDEKTDDIAELILAFMDKLTTQKVTKNQGRL